MAARYGLPATATDATAPCPCLVGAAEVGETQCPSFRHLIIFLFLILSLLFPVWQLQRIPVLRDLLDEQQRAVVWLSLLHVVIFGALPGTLFDVCYCLVRVCLSLLRR